MVSAHDELLEAAIWHLRELKSRGVRYVPVSPELLKGLDRPMLRSAAPSAPRPMTSGPPVAQQPAPASVPLPSSPGPKERLPLAVASTSETAPDTGAPGSRAAGAPAAASKQRALDDLRQRVLGCVKCSHLAAARTNVVFGVGNPDADLMFVGEAPGADEDLQGEPFVGKAGQLLTKIIQTMGLSRETVYIANILKCRPDMPAGSSGNRKPTPQEMQTCISHLHEQIDIIQPKVIVALGATAVEGLLGRTEGITRLRGHWREYRGIPLMPTYHPAYLLRNQAMSEKRRVWEDMLQVMEKLELPISEKQRSYFLSGR